MPRPRKTFRDLVADVAAEVEELFPWDLAEEIEKGGAPILLDVRCPSEFERMRVPGSVNVPRGILETACDYGYEETEPYLVEARCKRIVVLCRSGNRSVLACHTMQQMGYENVASLKLGLRGWNDDDQPLCNEAGERIDPEAADGYFRPVLTPEQVGPGKRPHNNSAAPV